MSLMPFLLTTTGASAEVIATVPDRTQFELKLLTAFKDSTYTLNISKETEHGFQSIFTETITNGGLVTTDDPIVLNAGDKLVSQSSSAGININVTFQVNSSL